MGKGFNLAETFGEALVSKSGTGPEQLIHPDIDRLHDDPSNFYSMEGLDDLAANIELIGLQQPIRVRPDPEHKNHFIIVSGHRRTAALRRLLRDEDRLEWRCPPCIVEQDAVSPAMQELRLIYANSATREMSDADKAKQAERVEAILYELQEQGYEFPGRMRDHVAEACRISKSKLARLKVIREKLYEPIKRAWEAGQISEASAYLLAQQDPKIQETVHRKYSSTAWHMTTDDLAKVVDRCKSDALNKALDNFDKIIHKDQAPEKTMAEIGEDYVAQLQREDKRVYEVLRKCADRFICGLVKGQTTRRDSIELLRVGMRNSAWAGGGVDCDARNDGLTVDSLSRHPIKRSWTEVWDVLALIALQEWSVNSESSAKNTREREALQNMREKIEHAPVIQWMPGQAKPPENVTLLTSNYTNVGIVYRAAVWTGERWVDPANRKKELTGLQVGSWMRVPERHQTFVEGPASDSAPAAAGGWIPAETLPDHPCECVTEFVLGGGYLDKILCRWDGDTWRWRNDDHLIDMPAIRWCEVPCAAPPRPVPAVLDTTSDASAWISVKDALPEKGVDVVIVDEAGDLDIDSLSRTDGAWFYTEPLYWMPIPEIPELQDNGEEDSDEDL